MTSKKQTKARYWCFTINNPTDEDDPAGWEKPSAIRWQKEKGDDGTVHYQGYCEFKQQQALTAMKKINGRAHWETRKGSQIEAVAYVEKEDTRIEGPWEKGELSGGQGARTDLYEVGKAIIAGVKIKEISEDAPQLYIQFGRGMEKLAALHAPKYKHHETRGEWWYGEPGTGKSMAARTEYPDAFSKMQNKWWDGYQFEDHVILDDLDMLGGQTLGHHLKIWGDSYFATGEIKGGTLNLNHKKLIITSNYTPEEMWPDDPVLVKAIKRRYPARHFKVLKENDVDPAPPAKRRKLAPITSYVGGIVRAEEEE